jgi:PAS domain S-box-containing protein
VQTLLREGIETARSGETWGSTLPYRWADGTERSLDLRLHPIRDEIGQVIFIHATGTDITEQRAAQEELRSVANAAPALVWVADESGEFTYFNDRWYQYTGLTPEGSLGSGWRSAVAEEDLEAMLSRWERSRATGEPFEGECRYRRSDGEYLWHAFRALPRYDKNGKITTWYGVSIDIQRVKIATDRVKTSEERYRALTELSPQMVYMSTPDGAITYVNTYTRDWTGKTLEELQGDGWANLIHPDHRERISNVWKTAKSVAAEYEVDIPLLHVDGTYRALYTRALPIKDEDGEILYWIGTALDVEDRKRAEENLRESEERFRQVSDSAPVLIWMSNEEKERIWFNKAWLDFTGRPIEAEIDRGWFEDLHPDDHDRFINIFSNSFDSRQEFMIEYRLRGRDGEYRWFMDRGVPRFTPDGTFLGYIGSCVDIHDRRSAESALRRSEARLQLATRIGNYGTWDYNFVTEHQVWSDKLFEIFGLPSTTDRVVSRDLYESCIYPEDLQRLYKVHEEASANHGQYAIEYRIRRADTGETRWLDVAAQNFYDPKGTPIRSVGITQDITERKLADEAVRASEERLKLAQQAGNVGVWDWNVVDGSFFWSEQMWSFYGEKPRKLDFKDGLWKERLHPNDRGRMLRAVRSALASDCTEFKEEFRILRRDGEVRWLEVIATIDRNSEGSPLRVYGVNLDITERKAIAERIRTSEAQLRLITDSIPALVSYIDRDERYRFVNRQYSEWFGRESDEFIGRSMAEILGMRAWDRIRPHIESVLKGETVSFESWVDYTAAGRRYVHVSYVPDFSTSGEVLGFYALVTDLSAQKLSEERLRSTEDRMRTISESFTDYAIISMDSEGRIDSWNPGAENIFGFNPDEIIGKHAKILFTPEDIERGVHDEELRRARELGRASDERWHVRKDGSRFFASGVTAPLYIGEELAGYAKITTDLTEKKRGAEALQRAYDEMESRVLERTRELASMNETLMREISERHTAERQKIELLKRLVSGQEVERRRIARDLHDHLGQRLTALRLKLASLREATAGNEDLYGRATRLQQIAELIDSEVSFLAWELRPSTLDELGLIDAMGAFVKEWSKHYEINAEFHSAGLGDARLDREAETHLYRITQEALNNIYKHANAKNVSVLIERAGNQVVLIVEDDGGGFTQAEAQRHRKSNRGLGLAGMRERADLIGGTLEIESEVGKGTTIYVRIPLETDQRNKR